MVERSVSPGVTPVREWIRCKPMSAQPVFPGWSASAPGGLLSIFFSWSLQLTGFNVCNAHGPSQQGALLFTVKWLSSHCNSSEWVSVCVHVRRVMEAEIFQLEPGYVTRTGEWHEHGGRIVQTCLGSGSNPVWLELQVLEEWKFEVKEWGHVRDGLKARSEASDSRERQAGLVTGGSELGWQTRRSTLALEFNLLCGALFIKWDYGSFPIKLSCRLDYIAYVKRLFVKWMVNEFSKLLVPFS